MGTERDDPGRRRTIYSSDRSNDGRSYHDHQDDSGFSYNRRDPQTANRNYERDDDRGFIDRAGDEVRSWFGDDEAERRRERDARERGREWRGDTRPEDRNYYGGGTGYGGAGSTGRSSSRQDFDPHYASWRQRQIDNLDRDYHEYRQHSQNKFENDFGGWRNQRQTQRQMLDQVEEHAEVLGSDGQHVGKVDKVKGDRILLTKSDPDAGGHHHSIPSLWLQAVDGGRIVISKTADEAKRAWRDEDRNSAMFGDRNRPENGDGPHILNRSFSGTY